MGSEIKAWQQRTTYVNRIPGRSKKKRFNDGAENEVMWNLSMTQTSTLFFNYLTIILYILLQANKV